jgi:hypothetical protein
MRYTLAYRGSPVAAFRLSRRPAPRNQKLAEVTPLRGYAAIRPVVRAASEAEEALGYLGPVSDPASSAAGAEAMRRARVLFDEMEVLDERGRRLEARVLSLSENVSAIHDDEGPAGIAVFMSVTVEFPAGFPPPRR